MTTATIDTIEMTLVVPATHAELTCTIDDGRVATHELVGPLPCRHVYCLEHADVMSRFVEAMSGAGPVTVECASHRRFFQSDCSTWRLVPVRGVRL